MTKQASLYISAYLIASTLLLILNKLSLVVYSYPYTLTYLQLLFFCVFTICFEVVHILKFGRSRYGVFVSRKVMKTFILPGFAWGLPLAFNMQALSYLNPDTVIVFRVATLFGVAAGDHFLFKKKLVQHQRLSLLFTFLGAYVYAFSNLNFSGRGYFFGFLYWLFFILSQLLTKFAFVTNHKESIMTKAFYINLFGSIPNIILGLAFEGTPFQQLIAVDMMNMLPITFSFVFGVILSYIASYVRDILSATSFDILGCAGKFFTILLSSFVFPIPYNTGMVAGILLSITSSLMFSRAFYAKLLDLQYGGKCLRAVLCISFLIFLLPLCPHDFVFKASKENISRIEAEIILPERRSSGSGALSLCILCEITNFFSRDHHSLRELSSFLEKMRSAIIPWIHSYDHSSYEMVGHVDIDCLSSFTDSHQALLSHWYKLMGKDKRELLLVRKNEPGIIRLIDGIVSSQSDLVMVLADKEHLKLSSTKIGDYWAEKIIQSFEDDPQNAMVTVYDTSVLEKSTLVFFIVRRAAFVELHRDYGFDQIYYPKCGDIRYDFRQNIKSYIEKHKGFKDIEYGIEVLQVQKKLLEVAEKKVSFDSRIFRGASGMFPLKRSKSFTKGSIVLHELNQCKRRLESALKSSQISHQQKEIQESKTFAKPGVSYLNSQINSIDLELTKLARSTDIPESNLSVTFSIEFFKHKQNIVRVLNAYRKIIRRRGANGVRDRIVILDDGSHDGSFELLLSHIEGPRESILALNNVEQIRAYTRSLHMSSSDIWIMLQDDDLPSNPNGEKNWLMNALKLFDTHPSLGAISMMCSYTTAYVYGNTWGHCKAKEGIPTIDPCTGVEFMFAVSGDSAPILYRREVIEEAGGLLFSWNAPIQLTDEFFNFSTEKSYSYMVGAEAEVAYRMWRNGYTWVSMRAPGIIRSFGGKGTYHGIERSKALGTDLPPHMKWRRYMLWRQNRRMKLEHIQRYSFQERKEISVEVERMNKELICRRPIGVKRCSLFRPEAPRKSVEVGKVALKETAFKAILNGVEEIFTCPIDKLAVVSDEEIRGDRDLFWNRPWPGNSGSWIRCEYVAGSVYWYQGTHYVIKRNGEVKGWVPSWSQSYLGLKNIL